MRNTRAMWEESLRMIPRIWEDGPFSAEGQFWKVPPRDVRPKPYQKPHPPIWVAALQPATYELAAETGIGVMALSVAAPSYLAPHIKRYKERVRHARPVGKFINDQWLSSTMALCDSDDKGARELAAKSLRTFFGPDRPYLKDQTHDEPSAKMLASFVRPRQAMFLNYGFSITWGRIAAKRYYHFEAVKDGLSE